MAIAALPVGAREVGSFTLDASMGVELLDVDNVFRSTLDPKSSRVFVLTPAIQMGAEPSEHRLELGYSGEYAKYSEFSTDDYSDHSLSFGAYLNLGSRSGIDLVASRDEGHEDRGTGLTQGVDFEDLPTVPDEFTADDALARFRYGTGEGIASLEIEAGRRRTEYQNNLERTRVFDHENQRGALRLGLAVSSATELQLVAESQNIRYRLLRQPNNDSREDRYLLGVNWQPSGKTTGSFRIGRVRKMFNDPTKQPFSAPNWEAELVWSPRPYSHVDIATERFPTESTTKTGDVIDNERYAISWTHEWTDRVETTISGETLGQEFRDAIEGRIQDYRRLSLAVRYVMRDWLSWEASVENVHQDSNIARYAFDGGIIKVGALMVF